MTPLFEIPACADAFTAAAARRLAAELEALAACRRRLDAAAAREAELGCPDAAATMRRAVRAIGASLAELELVRLAAGAELAALPLHPAAEAPAHA